LQGLIRHLLVESEENLKIWKEHIIGSLTQNAQIIIDLIPEVEQIIGKQSPIIELNPVEVQNRFQMILRDFIKVFAKMEHPLVIFLDDLQWSDISTLDLLKYLLGSSDVQYILFIGAYRKNEVNPGHPLLLMLEDMKKKSQDLHQLFLKPLKKSDINQLISDTFRSHPENTRALTDIIFQKTKGNPFFIN